MRLYFFYFKSALFSDLSVEKAAIPSLCVRTSQFDGEFAEILTASFTIASAFLPVEHFSVVHR
jgi:hypothetical protein